MQRSSAGLLLPLSAALFLCGSVSAKPVPSQGPPPRTSDVRSGLTGVLKLSCTRCPLDESVKIELTIRNESKNVIELSRTVYGAPQLALSYFDEKGDAVPPLPPPMPPAPGDTADVLPLAPGESRHWTYGALPISEERLTPGRYTMRARTIASNTVAFEIVAKTGTGTGSPTAQAR